MQPRQNIAKSAFEIIAEETRRLFTNKSADALRNMPAREILTSKVVEHINSYYKLGENDYIHFSYKEDEARLKIDDQKIDDVENVDLTGMTIRIHYVKKSADLSLANDLGNSYSDIPSVLHDGLISRVLEKLNIKMGNIPLAQYYKAEWLDTIRKAKKIKNQGKDGSYYNINQHEY